MQQHNQQANYTNENENNMRTKEYHIITVIDNYNYMRCI